MRPACLLLLMLTIPGTLVEGQVRMRLGAMIPMRDGVRLSADLWMPAAPRP
jgi:predicted acyl esterase